MLSWMSASPEKRGGHRALADIQESIRELQYYREVIFVPVPGPDSATAREVAARIAAVGGQASGSADEPAADSAADGQSDSAD